MRERTFGAFLGGVLTLLSATAYAGSAPKELYGKSIYIVWFESRAESGRRGGGLRNPKIAVYISTAGHIFSRLRVEIAMGKTNGMRKLCWVVPIATPVSDKHSQISKRSVPS
jgi:hypothetical protein